MINRTIQLNKTDYDPFIDYLKGVAILFVVLTHALPHHEEMAFCLWIDQAVPLFLLIQVFHAYKHGLEGQTLKGKLPKMWQRIVKPFVISQGIVLLLLMVAYSFMDKSVPTLIQGVVASGGIGPGSYYIWIYLQFFLILPIVAKFFIYKRLGGGILTYISGLHIIRSNLLVDTNTRQNLSPAMLPLYLLDISWLRMDKARHSA